MEHTFDIEALTRDGVVYDSSGDKIGKVGQVYLDDSSGEPEWVTVSTGLFGTSETFVPLRGATSQGSELHVPLTKSVVKDAPRVDADQHLSQEQERELFRYYQDVAGRDGDGNGSMETGTRSQGDVDDGQRGTDHGPGPTPVGNDVSGREDDGAMTRSEERLDVHAERQETGRARLRKYVVTENVTTTVPVQREEVRLEREPITDANADEISGGDLREEEHDVTLSEERVVVDKETVPVERVRLDKETVTDQEQVDGEVRKERIEADLPDDQTTDDRSDRL